MQSKCPTHCDNFAPFLLYFYFTLLFEPPKQCSRVVITTSLLMTLGSWICHYFASGHYLGHTWHCMGASRAIPGDSWGSRGAEDLARVDHIQGPQPDPSTVSQLLFEEKDFPLCEGLRAIPKVFDSLGLGPNVRA